MNRLTVNTAYRPGNEELVSFLRATGFQSSVPMDEYVEKVQSNAVFVSLQDGKGIMKGLSISYMNRQERDFAYLTYIAVCKDVRGNGRGKSLLLESIFLARQKDFGRFRLEVRKDNIVARHLYESLGFTYVGKTDYSDYMELAL